MTLSISLDLVWSYLFFITISLSHSNNWIDPYHFQLLHIFSSQSVASISPCLHQGSILFPPAFLELFITFVCGMLFILPLTQLQVFYTYMYEGGTNWTAFPFINEYPHSWNKSWTYLVGLWFNQCNTYKLHVLNTPSPVSYMYFHSRFICFSSFTLFLSGRKG